MNRKICDAYIMEDYSSIVLNGILIFGTMWMDLEGVMTSEMSYTGKTSVV